jgi:hypothetical protein
MKGAGRIQKPQQRDENRDHDCAKKNGKKTDLLLMG